MEDKILIYSELTPEEQREVERHVQEHPEMRPLLEEAKAFSALLGDARLLRADSPGDEALSYYIATRHVSREPLPPSLHEAFAGIEEKLTDDAALRTRYAELVRRMAVLEATTDPVKQFEQLSGRSLPGAVPEALVSEADEPAEAEVPVPKRAVIHRLWWHAGRWAVAAVFFGVAVYGSLGLVSHFSQSDLDQLAALSTIEVQDFQMRGGSGEPVPDLVSSEELRDRAVLLLQEARTHTLGLFPHYDPATLSEAADLLQRVVEQEPETSTLRSDAYFLLARVRLAQKNVDGARAALHAVINGSGWKAVEAQALLNDLERLLN